MRADKTLYNELSYYTFSLQDSYFIHQHIVDAYAAQTADADTKPITLTFALAGLYLFLEKGFTGRQVQLMHTKMAKQKKSWPVFSLPAQRGKITVADVLAVPVGKAREKVIKQWCDSVWEAYKESHKKIADLLQPFLL